MAEFLRVDVEDLSTTDVSFVLSGTRSSGITSVTVNGVAATLEPGRWRKRVLLNPGENEFVIRGTHGVGFITQERTITTPVAVQVLENTFNALDEWGIMLGTPRLLGERNRSYDIRLRHAARFPGGAAQQRLVLGTSRDLGLEPRLADVLIKAGKSVENALHATGLIFSVDHVSVRFTAQEFLYTETVQIEPSWGTIDLPDGRPVADRDTIRLFLTGGGEIPKQDFRYDQWNHRITILNTEHRGRWVSLQYQYVSVHQLFGRTLAQLKTSIESVVTANSDAYVTMTITGNDTRAADGLSTVSEQSIPAAGLTLLWSNLSMRELFDRGYQEFWYNSAGHAYGTKLESWARQIALVTRSGWSQVILDVDNWEEDPVLDGLPHLFDALVTYWVAQGDETRYDTSLNHWLGGYTLDGKQLDRRGVPNDSWRSGIGGSKDLTPIDITPVVEG